MTEPAPTTEPTPGDPAPAPTPSAEPVEQPLGPAGKKALDAEREARKALEKQLADLAPLKQLADHTIAFDRVGIQDGQFREQAVVGGELAACSRKRDERVAAPPRQPEQLIQQAQERVY